MTALLLTLALLLGAEPAPTATLAPGDRAPYAGTLLREETLRELLHAQDERDALLAELAAERQARALEREGAGVELDEAQALGAACERARSGCEASRVPPPTRCECAWGGWPIVSGAAGAALGAVAGWGLAR